MKKVILGVLCMAVCFVLTMSCEIPQSITLKGSPGLKISINPFDMFMDEDTPGLEDYITIEKIREMMGNDSEATVYEYTGDQYPGIQTYVVHYPIDEMKMNLKEYIEEAIGGTDQEPVLATIPAYTGSFPSGGLYLGTDENDTPILTQEESEATPLFVITLTDLAKLVTVVEGGPFGFQIDSEEDTHLKDKIQVKIPAFGMNDYEDGVASEDGSKLWFYNSAKTTFWPHGDPDDQSTSAGPLNEKDQLEIFVKITDTCSGNIKLDLVFDWETATIDTSKFTPTDKEKYDYLKGSYPISNSLSGFLGEGVEFKKVDGYIYVNGMDIGGGTTNTATLTLTIDDEPLADYEDADLTDEERPTFSGTTFNGTLGTHSLGNSAIPLAQILNTPPADGESAIKLGYEIDAKITITKEEIELDEERTITIDLVILIPLEFKVTTASDKTGYYKLDLDDMFPKPKEGKDLFGRDSEDDDDLFNSIDIKSVTITVKGHKTNNTIIDDTNLSIAVLDANNSNSEMGWLDFNDTSPKMALNEGIPKPFTPQFEILLKETDPNDGFATLKIKRTANPVFNFTLDIEARTTIEYTMDL